MRTYNRVTPSSDPWVRLWAAILLQAYRDLQIKKEYHPYKWSAQKMLLSPWVQMMAQDINGINLQEMVK